MNYLTYVNHLTKSYNPRNKLIVGTDCSGTEAPIQALEMLGVKYDHAFSSDNDPDVIENIRHNFHPRMIYRDILKRNHSRLPKLDLYVCGFPCQTFSTLGKQMGFEDETKGTIFFECWETIKCTKPTVFILENVKGLLTHDQGRTFKTIINCLDRLKKYNIYYQLMNTKDYGIPQNRERIYIIGIDKKHDKGFRYPLPIPLEIGVSNILDPKLPPPELREYLYNSLTPHKIEIINDLIDLGKITNPRQPWIVNLNVSSAKRTTPMLDVSPTLLAGNGTGCIFYLVNQQRLLTPNEYMKLQGFHPKFKSVVSRQQTYKQAGNAMSVNVLCFLLVNIFKSVNF
jgi:DNA (cytosine-5)-methyltransferase 1|uniref:DNA (cytosine-5-)-methyltransferase n=1 Tax=viral metagenome TaxID=1070528 RepID=A0A6C0BJP0_9ZZZZ